LRKAWKGYGKQLTQVVMWIRKKMTSEGETQPQLRPGLMQER